MIDPEAGRDLPGRRLFAVVELAAAGMVAVVLLAVLFQSLARYVFDNPPFWTQELARYAMIWAGALGAAAAFRRGLDPRLVEPGALFRGRLRTIAEGVALVPAAVFSATLLLASLFGPNLDPARSFMARNLGRVSEALQINMALVVAAVPVMAALVLLAVGFRLTGIGRSLAADPAASAEPADTAEPPPLAAPEPPSSAAPFLPDRRAA